MRAWPVGHRTPCWFAGRLLHSSNSSKPAASCIAAREQHVVKGLESTMVKLYKTSLYTVDTEQL